MESSQEQCSPLFHHSDLFPFSTRHTELIPKTFFVTDSVTSSGIWLNVELSIGIVSACLPLLRPLFSRALSSQLRSRFSKSRTGSHRLQDLEASNGNGHSNGKNVSSGSGAGGGHQRGSAKAHGLAGKGSSGQHHAVGLGDSGIYAGQNRKQPHLNWLYDVKAGATSKGTMNGRGSEEGSEEDMVPMGKIQTPPSRGFIRLPYEEL
ncbi:hypothetical protein XANCAGTX0491_003416 [Xanthoria calcicola]